MSSARASCRTPAGSSSLQAERQTDERAGSHPADSARRAVFRAEALEELEHRRLNGDVVRLSPDWVERTYWVLLAAAVSMLSFVAVGTIQEYSPGEAVVRLGGRFDLTAPAPGTISSIEVHAGERVEPGQVLVRFYGADEMYTLERVDSEFEMQVIKMLDDPADGGARKELARLRAEKRLAEARLAERSLRAPRAGVVSEVRIRPGQLLQPGDLVLTLLDDQTPPSLVAILPGRFRPQLKRGTRLRFEPEGFKYTYQTLVVETVGDQVLGPSEVRRYLGSELADAVKIDGPSVIITAPLPSDHFKSEGKAYRYHHGLPGRVWARVRTRSLWRAFLPALSDAGEGEHGGG
jgi:membrane fusion protein (multidrug efflux system)